MLTFRGLAGLSGAVMMAAAAAAPIVQAQTTCDWYAKTALKQQQENEQRRCGFTGQGWSSDLKGHLAWCASVPPEKWKAEAQRRDQELATCARKK